VTVAERVYLDNAATTFLAPEVLAAMQPWLERPTANASSVHSLGQEARRAVEEARERIAGALGADPREIVLTGTGTEADNLAVRGVLSARPGPLVTSPAEHHAVLEPALALARQGVPVRWSPVGAHGAVTPAGVEELLPGASLASLMLANNETGAVTDIGAISALARREGVLVHTDAVQALGVMEVDVNRLGADLLTISAHKVHGPTGAAALYVRSGTPLNPLILGGGQEWGLRPGTFNVPAIVGMGVAVERAAAGWRETQGLLNERRDRLLTGLRAAPGVEVHSPAVTACPKVVTITVTDGQSDDLIAALDMRGFAVSAGSACTSGAVEPSHVLLAAGVAEDRARGALRISPSARSRIDEIDAFLDALLEVLSSGQRR
jgi:cysteine desulfurase